MYYIYILYTYYIYIYMYIYIYLYLLLLDSQTTGKPDVLGLGLPLDAFSRNF